MFLMDIEYWLDHFVFHSVLNDCCLAFSVIKRLAVILKSFFSFYFKNYFSFGLAFGGGLSNCVFYELILLGTWCVSWF